MCGTKPHLLFKWDTSRWNKRVNQVLVPWAQTAYAASPFHPPPGTGFGGSISKPLPRWTMRGVGFLPNSTVDLPRQLRKMVMRPAILGMQRLLHQYNHPTGKRQPNKQTQSKQMHHWTQVSSRGRLCTAEGQQFWAVPVMMIIDDNDNDEEEEEEDHDDDDDDDDFPDMVVVVAAVVVVVGWWRCWYRGGGGGGGGCGDDGDADADTDDVEARNTEVAPLSAAALLIFQRWCVKWHYVLNQGYPLLIKHGNVTSTIYGLFCHQNPWGDFCLPKIVGMTNPKQILHHQLGQQQFGSCHFLPHNARDVPQILFLQVVGTKSFKDVLGTQGLCQESSHEIVPTLCVSCRSCFSLLSFAWQ